MNFFIIMKFKKIKFFREYYLCKGFCFRGLELDFKLVV